MLSDAQIAAFIRPFMLVVVLYVLYLCRRAAEKWLPEGKLKRLLLRRVGR